MDEKHSHRKNLLQILILAVSLLLMISVNAVALASPSNDANHSTEDPVGSPGLYLPENNAVTDWTPYFEWTLGKNSENSWLIVDNDPDFGTPKIKVCIGNRKISYLVNPENVLSKGKYYWKVIAEDLPMENAESSTREFRVIQRTIMVYLDADCDLESYGY